MIRQIKLKQLISAKINNLNECKKINLTQIKINKIKEIF